jgi:hypothetical protein
MSNPIPSTDLMQDTAWDRLARKHTLHEREIDLPPHLTAPCTSSARYGCGGDCRGRAIGQPMDGNQVAKAIAQLTDSSSLVARAQPMLAYHEAGHVVFSVFAGFPIEYAQIGTDPRTAWAPPSEREQTYIAQLGKVVSSQNYLMNLMAGDVAVGVARRCIQGPLEPEMRFFIEKARRGEFGSCDQCKVAMALIGPPDDENAAMRCWASTFAATVALFDQLEFRIQLRRVATALLERGRLEGADIEALVDVDALRESARRATKFGAGHDEVPRS